MGISGHGIHLENAFTITLSQGEREQSKNSGQGPNTPVAEAAVYNCTTLLREKPR